MNNRFAPWGGSEELWGRTASLLRSQGHSVAVCMPDWQPRPARIRELAEAGARIRTDAPVRFSYLRQRIRRLLRRPADRPWEQRALAPTDGSPRPDLVVISQATNFDGWAWASACRDLGLPYVLVAQAATEAIAPGNAEFDAVAAAYAHAVASYFVSEHNRDLTADLLGRDLPSALVVRNPFLVPYADPPPWPGAAQGWRLAGVGRLDYSKGWDILFRVLQNPAWRRRSVRFSLFGQGHNSRSLEALADRLGVRDLVTFAGHVPDVRAVWQTHHALVLPTRAEGLPLALVEAALCGRPAVTTAVAGIPEITRDGETAFLSQGPDPAAFAAALERAWDKRADWQSMGARAGDFVRQRIPPDPVGDFARILLAAARPAA